MGTNNYNLEFLEGTTKTFKKIICFEVVSSTNDVAKKFLLNEKNEHKNFVIISNKQVCGRGKGSCVFLSPANIGVYMSIVLVQPQVNLRKIALASSLAVFRTISKVIGSGTKIKWPNDILINGKKVCGILIESAIGSSSNAQKHVIIGIGINVNNDKFNHSIANLATSLKKETGKSIDKNFVIANVLKELETLIKSTLGDLVEEYKHNLEEKSLLQMQSDDKLLADKLSHYL